MSNSLVIDFSEDFITLSHQDKIIATNLSVKDFFENTELSCDVIKRDLADNNIYFSDWCASLPISCLNHQIVTLPENVSDKEKMVFLRLELDKKLIGKRFAIQKLEVTTRVEAEQELCDYMLLAVKENIFKKLTLLALSLKKPVAAMVPSFYLHGAEEINQLRASVWLGETASEIVIWGKDNPLALASFENNGDQIGDVNRFIVDYFDNVDGLSLSKVFLFGPQMRDSALAYGVSYPYEIPEDPTRYLQYNLSYAPQCLNLINEIKLPNPPISWTPVNIGMMVCALVSFAFCVLSGMNYVHNFTLKRELIALRAKSTKYRKLLNEHKTLKVKEAEYEAEHEFYLNITKRRTPWKDILTDLSRLTPPEMWFDRLSANKNKLLIVGKASNVKDVSNFSINLNNNSKFINEALVIGTRDYEEAGQVYSEFQISTQLKSPTGKFDKITI